MSSSPHRLSAQRFASVLALVALFDGTRAWSGKRARKGLMSGPPGTQGLFSGGSGFTGGAAGVSTSLPGIQSNTTSQPINPNPIVPVLTGASVPFFLQCQRLTNGTVAALTPNVAPMCLVQVATEGGANPGSYSITYALNGGVAHFLGMSSGTDATGLISTGAKVLTYPVNYWLNSTSIPSGNTAFNATSGTHFCVTLTYSTVSFGGPDISAYRACHAKGSETATTGTARTFTFDAAPGVPRAFMAVMQQLATAATVASANVSYSGTAGYTFQVPCQGPTGQPVLVAAQPVPPGPSLGTTFTCTDLGGSTNVNLFALCFY